MRCRIGGIICWLLGVMAMSKHTPGPWKAGKELSSRSSEWLIAMDCGDRGRGIAIAETVPATGRELANARLIAAAPELLEALQNLMTRVQYDKDAKHWFTDEQKAARAAIAKALGEKDE